MKLIGILKPYWNRFIKECVSDLKRVMKGAAKCVRAGLHELANTALIIMVYPISYTPRRWRIASEANVIYEV